MPSLQAEKPGASSIMPGSGNETEWGWIMFSPQKPADLKETFDKQPLSLSKVAFFQLKWNKLYAQVKLDHETPRFGVENKDI